MYHQLGVSQKDKDKTLHDGSFRTTEGTSSHQKQRSPFTPAAASHKGGRRANGTSGFNTFHFVSGMALCEFAKSKKKKTFNPWKLSRRITITSAIKKTFSPYWLGMNNIKPLLNVPASFVSSALGFLFFLFMYFFCSFGLLGLSQNTEKVLQTRWIRAVRDLNSFIQVGGEQNVSCRWKVPSDCGCIRPLSITAPGEGSAACSSRSTADRWSSKQFITEPHRGKQPPAL